MKLNAETEEENVFDIYKVLLHQINFTDTNMQCKNKQVMMLVLVLQQSSTMINEVSAV